MQKAGRKKLLRFINHKAFAVVSFFPFASVLVLKNI